MKHNDAADELREFIDDPKHPERSRTWLAGILGISQAAVSQWLATENPTRPDTRHRGTIERLTGIPADAWLTAEERAEERERERRVRTLLKTGSTDGR